MTETLGPYELLGLIGKGGMGEVHLARDPKLDRKVALKLLPPELAEDPDRRSRFLREARAAATLNHPNITTVYDVGEDGGRDYIAHELLDGRPLGDILAERSLPLAELAGLALPLADALEYAHEQGVIHRDLKPANVIVTERGHAKLLDFGLAKVLHDDDKPNPAQGRSTTLTLSGVVMGTPSAMSPEQALGKPVDARADIFAFGSLLYEMAAGKPAFLGTTVQETLDKVLHGEPEPLGQVRRDLPSDFVRIVDKALRKDPEERYPSMAGLAADLRHFKRTTDSGVVPPAAARSDAPSGRQRALRTAAVAVVVAAAAWLARDFLGSAEQDGGSTSFRLTNPQQITSAAGREAWPSWSGAGGLIAYQARTRMDGVDRADEADGPGGADENRGVGRDDKTDIWVMQIGSSAPVNRTADLDGDCRFPSLSPDGSTILFSVVDSTVAQTPAGIYTTPVLTGPARLLFADESHPGPIPWSADGERLARLVLVPDEGWVIRISANSGETLREVPLPEDALQARADLAWSPDERLFAFQCTNASWAADTNRLWLLREEDGTYVPLTDGHTIARSPSFAPDGRAVHYVSNQGGALDLWRQALDATGLPVGDPVALTAGVGMETAKFSPDGKRLAYSQGGSIANIWRVPLGRDDLATWTDAKQVTFDEAIIEYAALSPDAEWLVATSDRSGNDDLWILPATGGAMRQLTTNASPDWFGQWSPDGEQVLFYAYRSGNRDLWILPAEGGPARQLTDHPGVDWFGRWSPDGTRIAYVHWGELAQQLMVTPVDPWDPRPIVTATENVMFPAAGSLWVDDQSLILAVDGEYALGSDTGEILRTYPGTGPATPCTMLPGTRSLLFGRDGQLVTLDLDTGEQRTLTALADRPGHLGFPCGASEDEVWFTWYQERGDLWLMDADDGR